MKFSSIEIRTYLLGLHLYVLGPHFYVPPLHRHAHAWFHSQFYSPSKCCALVSAMLVFPLNYLFLLFEYLL